jgi:predicted helicase
MPAKPEMDLFLSKSNNDIPWSESLKNYLRRQIKIRFRSTAIREAMYRPFVKKYVYFDQYLVERWYQLPHMLPTEKNERENRLICVSSPGSKQFSCLMTNRIPDLNLFAGASPVQCFPLYHYDKDGKNRSQNITNWALESFIDSYGDKGITKFDIFHYVYAVLNHPVYLKKYSANLRKELPRIPLIKAYRQMVNSGKNLARLHLYYYGQEEYPVKISTAFGSIPDWEIEKITIAKDRNSVILNKNLTLSNIPPEVFDYHIGNRSVLDWINDQYRIRKPRNVPQGDNPNNTDDPSGIVRLIGQLITISLGSLKIISELPAWDELK